MHFAVPVPGDVVWIRQRRWRVERAQRDRNVIRLDVRNRDERLTFLAPFDRPATIARTERISRVRASHAVARLAPAPSLPEGPRVLHEPVDERALPGAGGPGDPDDVGEPRRVEPAGRQRVERRLRGGRPALHHRDEPGERRPLSGAIAAR